VLARRWTVCARACGAGEHCPAERCRTAVKRKTSSEPVERIDSRARAALGELARKMVRWAIDNNAEVQSAEPVLPSALDDRARDNWRPLIALADTAGGKWPGRARAAALALSRRRHDEGIAVAVLAAIRELFAATYRPPGLQEHRCGPDGGPHQQVERVQPRQALERGATGPAAAAV